MEDGGIVYAWLTPPSCSPSPSGEVGRGYSLSDSFICFNIRISPVGREVYRGFHLQAVRVHDAIDIDL